MILITGASGQLATAFRPLLPDATYLTRGELDLAHPESVAPTLDRLQPDVIINCAAYTAVDAAETDEATARLVNAESVGEMASWAQRHNRRLVTFSTDYVFNGSATEPYTESSPTDPISAYGRTKLDGERLALEYTSGALVIRTSWLISGTHRNFVSTMLQLASKQDVRVVDDQHGCPTIASDLALAVLAGLEAGATGLVHLANQEVTTWFELARVAVDLGGGDPSRVKACSSDEFVRAAARPAYSALVSERLSELALAALPPWRRSLPSLVEEMRQWLVLRGGSP